MGTTSFASILVEFSRRPHVCYRRLHAAGFDLEATTEVRAEDRERLEHLCSAALLVVGLRPPLAERRLRLLPGGTSCPATVALAANSARREDVVPELLDYARPKNATFCELMLSLRFAD